VGGAVLAPTFSAVDAAVTLVPTVGLGISDFEIAGDCSTSASFALLPNASWPEAFLPLSNVVGGRFTHKQKTSIKMEAQRAEYTKQDMK
jgi:hypothetical protein